MGTRSPRRTSTILGIGMVGLLIGGAVLIIVLAAARQDRPEDGRCAELWMLIGAEFVTETSVVWDTGVSGVRFGTDSPTGDVDETPNAMIQPDGSLTLR